jgi:organic hydroperoxide reductase OsmC/OhrA
MESRARISWRNDGAPFTYDRYTREHEWRFDTVFTVAASASPEYRGKSENIDPEKAFVAALASCHMLSFLALAARKNWTVEAYDDNAVGILEKNAQGRLAITKVTLNPAVRFASAISLPRSEIENLHHRAHEECFIANSVKTEVHVEPQF